MQSGKMTIRIRKCQWICAIFSAMSGKSDLLLLWTVQKSQTVCGRKGKLHGTDSRRHM